MTTQRHDPRSRTGSFGSSATRSALALRRAGGTRARLAALSALGLGLALSGCVEAVGDFKVSVCEGAECEPIWVRRFGGEGPQHVHAIASAPDSGVVLAGELEGQLDLGETSLMSAGDTDGFVAKLTSAGKLAWAMSFGAATGDGALAVTVDAASGDVFVTGYFSGTASFAGQKLSSQGGRDTFVARLNGDDGTLGWVKSFGGPDRQDGHAIAVDTAGNVLVTGCVTGMNRETDAFVLKLDPAGTMLWQVGATGAGNDCGASITTDAGNNVLVAGHFGDTLALSPLMEIKGKAKSNAFVVKIDPNAGPLWSAAYSGATNVGGIAQIGGIALLSGSFSRGFEIGDSTAFIAANASDPFLVKLAADGTMGKGQELGVFDLKGNEPQEALGSAFFTIDNMTGTLYLTGTSSPSDTDTDVYLSKLGMDGVIEETTIWRGPGLQSGQAVAVDPTGHVLLAGELNDTFRFGEEALESAGDTDIFVAKLGAAALP